MVRSTTTARPVAVRPAATTTTAPVSSPVTSSGLKGRLIVVDPGHNGANGSHTAEISRLVNAGGFQKECNTTGTAGGSYSEARFNFETAVRVRAALESAGAIVIMTRTDNNGWGPCIDARGQVAATNNADLLVSIHADGAASGNRGFHVIYPPSIAGYTSRSFADSKRMAVGLRDALVAHGLSTSNYIGSAGLDQRGDLGTLNRAEVPAIMIESGNMRDATDLAMLKSAAGQQRIADSIRDAAIKFFGQ